MNPKLTPDRVRRRAVVYVRQSSPGQVLHHQESQLATWASRTSSPSMTIWCQCRTASGLMERPGFQRLVGAVCTGEVGAVFCIEASRLARNGRDWHHLIELCGMVGAVLQQAIQLVFGKLEELGSVRQTLLWFRQQNVSIPVLPPDPGEPPVVWKLPVYRQIWAILTNPLYAGA